MRKILIPTDFSENAMNAIRYALELFKYEKSIFYIMHAYADEVYDHDALVSREILEELKEIVKNSCIVELKDTLKIIDQISPNPRHEYRVIPAFGTLIDEANAIVDSENIDVLIMGTKGKRNDQNLTFGSNTLQVLKYVKCPVLAIPSGYNWKQPKNVLFPTDYFLPYKRRELKLVSTLTKSFRSTVHLLHVSKHEKISIRQEDNKAFLKECLFDTDIKSHTIASDTLTEAINNFVESHKIDFLILVNSRHSYLENILYQSTIDKIGLHIKIPFLTMQNLQRY